MAKSAHGGKRGKSGRKPVVDKKVAICIYIQQSRIDALGLDAIKEGFIKFIENKFNEKDKW